MLNQNLTNEEFLDVINDDDEVIGVRSRQDIHNLGLLHREVHVWLFDKDRNIYFQKSPAHKTSAGLMDASVGGHVDKGEEYLPAAIRETKEESGLSILADDLIFLVKFRGISEHKIKKKINNFSRAIYIYKYPIADEQLKADPRETDGFHKFSLDFLLKMSKEEALLFHKFVPTHEIPHILNYFKSI